MKRKAANDLSTTGRAGSGGGADAGTSGGAGVSPAAATGKVGSVKTKKRAARRSRHRHRRRVAKAGGAAEAADDEGAVPVNEANDGGAAQLWAAEPGLLHALVQCCRASSYIKACVVGSIYAMARDSKAALLLGQAGVPEKLLDPCLKASITSDHGPEVRDRERAALACAAMALLCIRQVVQPPSAGAEQAQAPAAVPATVASGGAAAEAASALPVAGAASAAETFGVPFGEELEVARRGLDAARHAARLEAEASARRREAERAAEAEAAEAAAAAIEAAQRAEEARASAEALRARFLGLVPATPPENEPAGETILVRVRLGVDGGGVIQRRFSSTDTVEGVRAWVGAEYPTRATPPLSAGFRLQTQPLPGAPAVELADPRAAIGAAGVRGQTLIVVHEREPALADMQ